MITAGGGDVTEACRRGGEEAVKLALRLSCKAALLKARSPAWGSGAICDGSFTHARIPGGGVTAQALQGAGLPVFDEEHWIDFINYVNQEDAP